MTERVRRIRRGKIVGYRRKLVVVQKLADAIEPDEVLGVAHAAKETLEDLCNHVNVLADHMILPLLVSSFALGRARLILRCRQPRKQR